MIADGLAQVHELAPGSMHTVSNSSLDDFTWPKVRKVQEGLSSVLRKLRTTEEASLEEVVDDLLQETARVMTDTSE